MCANIASYGLPRPVGIELKFPDNRDFDLDFVGGYFVLF